MKRFRHKPAPGEPKMIRLSLVIDERFEHVLHGTLNRLRYEGVPVGPPEPVVRKSTEEVQQ